MLRGVIFDLDNTLVDSQLDFELMRQEMSLPSGLPILEAIAQLDPPTAAWCHDVLHRHELAGAARATALPGARELFAQLHRRRLPIGIATRNSRAMAEEMLRKCGLGCDLLITRDCGPVKPDPWPVQFICDEWQVSPREVLMIGDHRFDVESGRAAGAKTVLLTHDIDPASYANHERADLVLRSLADYKTLLQQMIDGE
jgi:HAD superfamily hydrolase (TIGR01549 family)